MPDQTYQITAPDGRTLRVTGPAPPTEADLDQMFKDLPPMESATPQSGAAGRFGAGVVESVNPLPLLGGLTNPSQSAAERGLLSGMGAPPGTFDVVRGALGAQADQLKQGGAAIDRGDYVEGALRSAAGIVPILGPMAAHVADKAISGDWAGAAGNVLGAAIPLKVPRLARAAKPGTLTARAAELAARGAEKRVVDVMTPKGSSREIRTAGRQAAKVAPKVLDEPGMVPSTSRSSLAEKIEAKKDEIAAQYDEVKPVNPNQLHDTAPVVEGLKSKIRELQAETGTGPEAHFQVEKMGVNTLPERPPSSAMPFNELPVQYKQELRRIVAELEEFQFQEGRKVSLAEEGVRRESGVGGVGRGARVRSARTSMPKDYIQREAGAPAYHEVLQGKKGTTRNAMIKSLSRYVDGTGKSTPIVDRAIALSDKRLRDPDSVSRPMLPPDAGFAMSDVEGPIGQNVTPGPSQPRVRVLQQMLQEVQDLGPAATEEALLRLRQAWDKPAKAVYTQSMTPDYQIRNAEKMGAADGTSVLRDALAVINPERAKVNLDYKIWKTADDVMKLAEEQERVRPKVGRQIMARSAGAMAGGGVTGGVAGMLAGGFLGGVVDSMISQGLTSKLMTASLLGRLAKAMRKGDEAAAMAAIRALRTVRQKATRATNLATSERE